MLADRDPRRFGKARLYAPTRSQHGAHPLRVQQ
jgi:hypothetical protein